MGKDAVNTKRRQWIIFLSILVLILVLVKQSTRAAEPAATINLEQFGIVPGDASPEVAKNNVDGFNKALQYMADNGITTVSVPAQYYYVDSQHDRGGMVSDQSINIPSNMSLDLNGATFQQIPNGKLSYAIFLVLDQDNIEIFNGTLIGDRNQHDYSFSSSVWGGSHEWGMGIEICGGSNVSVHHMDISEMTGDGIIVGAARALAQGGKLSSNVTIEDSEIYNNRRQGISVIGCDTILINNCDIHDIYGTPPSSCIDLENELDWPIKNVTISNNTLRGDPRGVSLSLHRGTDQVTISNNLIWAQVAVVHAKGIRMIGNEAQDQVFIQRQVVREEITFEDHYGRIVDNTPSAKRIDLFALNYLTAYIDEDTHEITGVQPPGSDLTSLLPEFQKDPPATVSPSNKQRMDFTSPQVFTAVALDGSTQDYTVTAINQAPATSIPQVIASNPMILDQRFAPENYIAVSLGNATHAEISSSDTSVAHPATPMVMQDSIQVIQLAGKGSTWLTVRFFIGASELPEYRATFRVDANGGGNLVADKGSQGAVGPYAEGTPDPVAPVAPTNPAVPTSPSTGGSGGSGGGGRADSPPANTAIPTSRAVTSATGKSAVKTALSVGAPQGKVAVKFSNYQTISAGVLQELQQMALTQAVSLTIHFDTVAEKAVQCRLSVPAEYRGDLKLGLSTNSKTAQQIKALFQKNFQNRIMVLDTAMSVDYTSPVQLTIKLEKDFPIEQIAVYSFDAKTKKCQRLEVSTTVDTKGYLHFSTTKGGILVISDGLLK